MDTLAFYKVDEGEGTTLNDSSGNENHATLSTSDAPSFWSGAPMVSQEIMDMEANGRGEELYDGMTGLGAGWSDGGDTYDCDGSQSSNSFIYEEAITGSSIGRTFECSCNATVLNGAFKFYVGGYDSSQWYSESGVHTARILVINGTANQRIYITADSSFEGSIDKDSITFKEVINNQYFTDGNGHALPTTQQDWEELGPELVTNGEFIYWTSDDPDNWTTASEDVDNQVTEVDGKCRMHGNGAVALSINQTALISGADNQVTIEVDSVADGALKVVIDSLNVATLDSVGTHTFNVTPTDTVLYIYRFDSGVSFDVTLASVSVREVNQTINNNKQYYFCPKNGLWIYKRVLTDEEHLQNVEYMYKNCEQQYEALYDSVSGQLVYDAVSLQLLYDEEA